MDCTQLRRMLDEGMSLAEIGRRVDRHESTVAYWVQRHGLQAVDRDKHTARGAIDRAGLERLVGTGASISQIAAELDRSKASVRHWLRRYGLVTAGHRGQSEREGAREARASGLRTAVLDCPRHGRTEHVSESRGYYRCRRCRQDAVIRRRRKVKLMLVSEAGGACQLCGYARCPAALEFHHTDPAAKSFGIARCGAHAIDRLRAEIRQCILLCSNCHAEVEAGFQVLVSEVAEEGDPG